MLWRRRWLTAAGKPWRPASTGAGALTAAPSKGPTALTAVSLEAERSARHLQRGIRGDRRRAVRQCGERCVPPAMGRFMAAVVVFAAAWTTRPPA